ncbi:MAG: sulfite exporter TauE/SafE family protein [Chloroflexi bacterium]|nr:MAG: sulfite exporter TauE/SafE family protein [Chloroflexota bacterium]RLC79483.1 MAG: sulfite exporter TauE/SafE family protein [Chloroflexota bacterium]
MNFTSILPILSIIFLATFTRSALGFGDALIAMPLLALVVSMQTATPLVAFGATTIAITILLKQWRNVDIKAAWRLILSSLIGIPFGLLLLKTAPESTVKAILGVVLIGFGLYNLIKPNLPPLRSEKLAYVFGWVAGVLGGAYNTNGPAVVIYGALRKWPPESFRATMQCYFLPTGLMILIGHGLAGLWTPTVLRLYAYSLPVILAAIFVGGKLNKVMSGGQFNRVIYALLIVMGALMFV